MGIKILFPSNHHIKLLETLVLRYFCSSVLQISQNTFQRIYYLHSVPLKERTSVPLVP